MISRLGLESTATTLVAPMLPPSGSDWTNSAFCRLDFHGVGARYAVESEFTGLSSSWYIDGSAINHKINATRTGYVRWHVNV